MKPILSISEAEVGRVLTVRQSIELARQAYVKRARKLVLEPIRTWFTIPDGASFYFMPAHVFGLKTVTVKVASVKRGNGNRHLPSTSATIYVFDSKTGSALARIAGNNLTAIRTAASSALATHILALRKADTLVIISTRKQAQTHILAILES